MVKDHLFVPLFEKFIKETENGKRRKLNGERIKQQTFKGYGPVLKLVLEYESFCGSALRIKTNIRNNARLLLQEHNYWKSFYRDFSDFLYKEKGFYDNFTGSVFKIIKSVFLFLKRDKCMAIEDFYKGFYVREENINIITLLPEQLFFLISDSDFEEKLSRKLKVLKDMFVFGCMAALRFSDLMNICVKDVEQENDNMFLRFTSVKTGTNVSLKLPAFACAIFKKYSCKKGPRQKLFRYLFLTNFNKGLKKIGNLAGWTKAVGKYRSQNGEKREIKACSGKLYRFCDLMSSHLMRRTGITVLLMLDMPESLVRKISGHSANSESFFKYVNFAQSYITTEIDKAHQKLLEINSGKK